MIGRDCRCPGCGTCDAASEVERLRAAAEESEHQMHLRIRAGYDKTIADSWRAKVAEVEAERDHERMVANEQLARAHDAVRERDEARAEVERLRAAYDRYGAAGVASVLGDLPPKGRDE